MTKMLKNGNHHAWLDWCKLFLCGLLVLRTPGAAAQDLPDSISFPIVPQVASCARGANLNDIAVVTESRLFAVGDRGLMLHSDSGGREWTEQSLPTTSNFHGIHFQDEEVGVAVGGWLGNYTRRSHAVIFRTVDGGRNWIPMPCANLPRLLGVRGELGRLVAWGDYSPALQTSVFESRDGGLSWQSTGLPLGHATAASVARGTAIAAVDLLGRASIAAGRSGSEQIQNIADVDRPLRCMHHTGTRWLACGDQGELIASRDGKTWIDVELPLTAAARTCCDWRTIAQTGNTVWVGGAPGSVLLSSHDGGATWSRVSVDSTLPIHAIQFFDSARGWMVGALGTILATRDGGKSWYHQRKTCDRLGLMAISTNDRVVPWAALVSGAWEQQIACASLVLGNCEAIEQADFLPSRNQLFSDVAPRLGIAQQWTSPPLQDFSAGPDTRLIVQLLTWRPDVIVLAQADSNEASQSSDPPSLSTAVLKAMDLGCRALNWNVAQELALPSWQVKKLVAVTDQRGAKYVEQPLRILRGPGLAICDLLHPLPPEILLANGSESMRTLWTETQSPAALTSLFGGVAPSNETHMELPIAGIGNYQLVMGRMHRQKFLKMLGNEQGRIASDQEWEDGLGVILKGFPDHEIGPAAFQLASWLSEPRDWLRKRLLLEYLIALRPNSDAADWARLSLLKMESSDEMRAWWKTQYEASLAAPMAALAGNFAEPLPVPSDGAIAESPSSLLDNSDSVWKQTPFGSDLPDKGLATRASTEVIAASAASASEITSESEHLQGWLATYETAIGQNPSLRQQPDLCLLGYRVYHRRADSRDDVSSRELDATVSAPQLIGWPQAAAQEKHLLEGQLSRVRWLSTAVHTAVPPILDGNLDESFWQIAQPMQLIALDETDHHSQSTASATLMRWAYDDEYLYVAIECATSPTAAPSPLQRVRGHDSRLDDSDRVEFTLDTDRDYNSAVELAIASDGRTYDRCMGLPEYNPKWHVFVRPQTDRWIAEIAIELGALTTHTPSAGSAWCISARRHRLDGPSQSWSQLRTHQPLLQGSGLLIFLPATL